MKIYHLSHTDLDGYACQYIVNFYFKNVNFIILIMVKRSMKILMQF